MSKTMMFTWVRRCAGLLLLAAMQARADGMQALDQFLQTVQYAQGSFVQVVTSPPRQGETVGRKKTSSGLFAISRPNKFRFEYQKPFEQLMLSDGRTVTIFDADLQQLTQRPLKDVMPGTPAVLLTGSNRSDLEKLFQLRNAPDRDGMQWVVATPRTKDSTIVRIALGFASGAQGAQINSFEVLDSFGQMSVMKLSQVSHAPVSDQQFVYKAK
jgi:outer membrane lipoprotein carrier protein